MEGNEELAAFSMKLNNMVQFEDILVSSIFVYVYRFYWIYLVSLKFECSVYISNNVIDCAVRREQSTASVSRSAMHTATPTSENKLDYERFVMVLISDAE